MPNLNKVLLMGNLTRDPELRVTPKGTPICQFSLAINRKWKTEAGVEQEEVLFADVEAWGKQGEAIAKYVTKGQPLYVEGRLRLDQWDDKNTKEKRSRMKVILEQFQFLNAKGATSPSESSGNTPAATGQARSSPPAGTSPTPKAAEKPAEDVPF